MELSLLPFILEPLLHLTPYFKKKVDAKRKASQDLFAERIALIDTQIAYLRDPVKGKVFHDVYLSGTAVELYLKCHRNMPRVNNWLVPERLQNGYLQKMYELEEALERFIPGWKGFGLDRKR